MIYDRKTGQITEEQVYKSHTMHFLYNTTLGGICVLCLRLPIVSKVYGLSEKSTRSKKKIQQLINDYSMGTFGDKHTSFNDFITRRETRTFEQAKQILIAPADSCLLVRNIEHGVMFSVKNKHYTLSQFLNNEKLAQDYEGGTCLIFRLRVYDYHRFCFIDDGMVQAQTRINGFLDSVNTNETGRFTLSSNYRELSVLETANFGDIIFAEVGAMLVGRIVHTNKDIQFCKGDEKGFFEFGGSTIVLLLKKDIVQIDEDILVHSSRGIETKVRYGERIGIKHA